ncbi:MAG: CgeB family protein [Terrimicrobiaceae bacterium]
MKVLLLGETYPWSAEISYAREMRKLGCDVTVWDNKRPSRLFGMRNWWELSLSERRIYDAIASWRFYHFAKSFRPELLFIPKAENIHSHAIKRILEETKSRLVMWYPDHPFKADMTSMNVLRNLRRCDKFYIWGKFLVDSIKAAGATSVDYLPFGFDPEMHPLHTEVSLADKNIYASKISFIGGWDLEREHDLSVLAPFGLSIWGPGWVENLPKGSPLKNSVRGSGLYNQDLVKAYKTSQIVFNHLRKHNGSAHNMRTMEIAGVGGGVQLVRRTDEQCKELFIENIHLLSYSTHHELINLLKDDYFASIDFRIISENAKARTLERHLLAHRFNKIMSDLHLIR